MIRSLLQYSHNMDSNSCSVQSSSGGCGADDESYDSRTILHQQNHPFFSHQQHLLAVATSVPPPSASSSSSSSSSTCAAAAAAAATGPTTMLNNNLLDHFSAGYLYYDPRSTSTPASAAFNIQDSQLNWPMITTALRPLIHSDLHTTAMMSDLMMQQQQLNDTITQPDAAVLLGRSSNLNTNNINNNASAPSRARPKKRSRASRRAPTTVLTTDTSNFRAMVQEFTGIPDPPFATPSFPTTGRFDLFGGSSSSAAQEPISNSSYLLRPSAHRPRPPPPVLIHHHQLPNSVTTTTTINNSNFAHQQQTNTTSTRADFATFTASLLQTGGGPSINKYVTREEAAMQSRTTKSNDRGGGLDEVIVGLGIQPQLDDDNNNDAAASVDGLSK